MPWLGMVPYTSRAGLRSGLGPVGALRRAHPAAEPGVGGDEGAGGGAELGAVALAAAGTLGIANAQTKLKWAHVYETSEPFHKYSVWAAEEIKKRTNGKFEIQVFPASSLGKESEINQGLLTSEPTEG